MIRSITSYDLAAALDIQARGYPPEIRDGEAAFASRMAAAPGWCWAVETDGRLDAYLLSHPWTSMRPPEPDTVLDAAMGDVWYIHDLSVAPWARGQGLGHQLLAACLDAQRQITRSELIAVDGAAPFWSRLGWSPLGRPEDALASKLARYGPSAIYMTRDFD